MATLQTIHTLIPSLPDIQGSKGFLRLRQQYPVLLFQIYIFHHCIDKRIKQNEKQKIRN